MSGLRRRRLAPLAAVTAAALAFAILLIFVRLRWTRWSPPTTAPRPISTTWSPVTTRWSPATKAVTWLGSDPALATVIGAAAAFLPLRKPWRLAVYLLVTGAGAPLLARGYDLRWREGRHGLTW